MRNLLFEEMWHEGYRLREARDGEEALAIVQESMPDLIITDLRMPGGGVEYVCRLRMFAARCPIVVMTTFGDDNAEAEVLRAGATAYFNKPVHLSELKTRVKELIRPIQEAPEEEQ